MPVRFAPSFVAGITEKFPQFPFAVSAQIYNFAADLVTAHTLLKREPGANPGQSRCRVSCTTSRQHVYPLCAEIGSWEGLPGWGRAGRPAKSRMPRKILRGRDGRVRTTDALPCKAGRVLQTDVTAAAVRVSYAILFHYFLTQFFQRQTYSGWLITVLQ